MYIDFFQIVWTGASSKARVRSLWRLVPQCVVIPVAPKVKQAVVVGIY